MAFDSPRRAVVEVDERGRVSLAKFGIKGTSVVIETLPAGGVIIQPAVVMTEAEAAHFRNPEAVTALERGLADAKARRIHTRKLRSDS